MAGFGAGRGGGFLANLGEARYWATRNQSEYRDYPVLDPFGDRMYAAAEKTLNAQARGKAVLTISSGTRATDWKPDGDSALISPQRYHPVPSWRQAWRNIIGQPIQNRPAANLTNYLAVSGYGGVMPIDAQPFLDKSPAWSDPTRGRP